MNFKVNIKVCRVCMKSEDGLSLLKDLDLQTKFVFTTRLTLKTGDSMPAIICSKCVIRLKVAFEFVQLAHASEKNLRTFLDKISSDFQEVTKSSSTNCSPLPTTDIELLTMLEDTTEENSSSQDDNEQNANDLKNSKNPEENNKTMAKKSKIPEIDTAITELKHKTEPSKPEVIKDTFKEELSEIPEDDDEMVYYEEANFLEESENEDVSEEKLLHIENQTDGVELAETEESQVAKSDNGSQQQVDGYLHEYSAMLAEQEDNCSESIATQYIYEHSVGSFDMDTVGEVEEEDEMENVEEETEDMAESSHIEELHLYEDAEELLQDTDETMQMDEDNLPVADEFTEHINTTDVVIQDDAKSIGAHANESPSKVKSQKTTHKPARSAPKSRRVHTNSSINARFFCVKCNRDFSTKTNLTRHMATHEGVKPYQCTECSKSFSQNGSLKQHMYTHTGEKPFTCDVCNRGFTQCKSLVFHMRRHTGEKPFPCEHCGMLFRQKDGLKMHIIKHHMIRQTDGDVETHTCIICKKLLATKQALRIHMKKHINNHRTVQMQSNSSLSTDSGLLELLSEDDLLNEKSFIGDELSLTMDDISSSTQIVDAVTANTAKASRVKKFQCRKCYKCFAIKKNLLRHLTTHDVSVAELFQCQTCQVAFDTNYALRVHRVREHKETGINLNECEYCNITFVNVAELSAHNSAVHDANDQNCAECPDLNFKTQKQLLDHLMEHESLMHEVDDEGI